MIVMFNISFLVSDSLIGSTAKRELPMPGSRQDKKSKEFQGFLNSTCTFHINSPTRGERAPARSC